MSPFSKASPRRLTPALVLAAAAFALLGEVGCLMQPSFSASVVTADGDKVEVPLNSTPAPVTDGVVTVNSFQFAPWDMGKDKPKDIVFSFVVQFKEGAQPTSITVYDVTEAPVLQIFSDEKAHIVKNNLWGAVSSPFAPQDEHAKWILTLDNNVRVYRFTIKLADGTTHVLLKPVFVPANMKFFMRTQLGLG